MKLSDVLLEHAGTVTLVRPEWVRAVRRLERIATLAMDLTKELNGSYTIPPATDEDLLH